MSIQLFKHNQIAYTSAVSMLERTGRAAVVHPTGTGKSFIAFKLCEEHPEKRICWLSPSAYIFRTQMENWRTAGASLPDNIIFYTYAKLMLMTTAELSSISPDYIILDEFHRCGGAVWGQGVERLIQMYDGTPVLGLSATKIRYLDNQRDMAQELFDGNIASELSLGEAIVRGILKPPKYVLSIYGADQDIQKYRMQVRSAKSKHVRDEAEQYLEAMRRALEKADGLDVVFKKHMTEPKGKYIVFCSGREHMEEMIKKASEWFVQIDSHPHIYRVYSEDPETEQSFSDFKADESDHLKLLYCIDMLNEGVHVSDISGVILLRPTVSPIVYKQQIGRAFSAGGKRNAVIFDIVLNIENLFSIGTIEEEMQAAVTYYRSRGCENEIVNERFRIVDEVRHCISLFRKLNDTLGASWELMYGEARHFYEIYGNLDVPKRFITSQGYSLGAWLNTQRGVYSGRRKGTLTPEQIQKLNEIGMRWDNLRDISWNRYYEAAKAYSRLHGSLAVTATYVTEDGIHLGRWLTQLRTYKKSGIQSGFLTKDRIKALDALGMVWNVPDYLWEQNYYSALKYFRKNGHLDVPAGYVDDEGIRLGNWIFSLRTLRHRQQAYTVSDQNQKNMDRRQELTENQIQRLDEIGMIWEKKHYVNWEKSFQEACKYKEQFGDLNVASNYVTDSGCKLGRWLRAQRDTYKKSLLHKESLDQDSVWQQRWQRLESIGMIWEKTNSWEDKYKLAKRYFEDHGNARVPGNYVSEGVWLGKWLNEQKLIIDGRRKNKTLTFEQTEKLAQIGIKKGISRKEEVWNCQYELARTYYLETGNLNIPRRYISADGSKLGIWIQKQRSSYKTGVLSTEQTQRLNAIGMIWDIENYKWDKAFRTAKDYYQQYGSLAYSASMPMDLKKWLKKQQSDKEQLSPEKIEKLNAIGMVWNSDCKKTKRAG